MLKGLIVKSQTAAFMFAQNTHQSTKVKQSFWNMSRMNPRWRSSGRKLVLHQFQKNEVSSDLCVFHLIILFQLQNADLNLTSRMGSNLTGNQTHSDVHHEETNQRLTLTDLSWSALRKRGRIIWRKLLVRSSLGWLLALLIEPFNLLLRKLCSMEEEEGDQRVKQMKKGRMRRFRLEWLLKDGDGSKSEPSPVWNDHEEIKKHVLFVRDAVKKINKGNQTKKMKDVTERANGKFINRQ